MKQRNRFLPESVAKKREPETLTCYCCGSTYTRGSFQCCQRPNGMRGDKWQSLWCPSVESGGCGRCPRHCHCPSKVERLGKGPLIPLLQQFLDSIEKPA